jgi:hypothetical protein
MSTTTTPYPGVPVPAGVTRVDDWQDDAAAPYRIVMGELRNTNGVEHTTVQATAVQYADGRIDDGSVHEPPCVYLGDDGLTSAQAGVRMNWMVRCVVMSDKPSEISKTIIEATEAIEFPRLADVTSAAVHDLRLGLNQGIPPTALIVALANSIVLLIGRLEHEIVKLTNEPINVPPTG